MTGRVPALDRLLGSTRAEILALLRPAAATVAELAAELELTANAVRVHLSGLERDGWVRSAGVRRETGGKPALLFELTAVGEELFPKAYDLVLTEVLSTLRERSSADGVESLLRDVGRRLGAAYVRGDLALVERVRVAAEVLRTLGGDLEIVETSTGWTLQGRGCPLSGVVHQHGQVCALAESMLSTIVGAPVREQCQREPRPRCAFHISALPG